MTVIQTILILCFVLFLLRLVLAAPSHQVRAGRILLAIGFFMAATLAVLFPDLLTFIAHKTGVGLGSNLLLYVLTLAFMYQTISLYMSHQAQQDEQIKFVRRLAILEANQDKHNLRPNHQRKSN